MVGAKIANILESLYKNEKVAASANSLLDGLGSEANAFLDQSVLQLVRKIFLRKFDAKQDADIGKHSHADVRASYCDALWERILQEASDPEVSLPIWMREGAPAGIHMRIACHGVFPAANGPSKQVEPSRAHSKANVEFESAKHVNYRSFYDTVDGEVLSKSEIERLLQQGFLEQFDSWQQVLDQWPDAVASRVACIAKRRADLTFKLRLTLDLLRSGVNGDCHVPKKVILPRLEDYVSSILDVFEQALAEGYAPQQVYDMTTLDTIDFADAFHTLFAHPSERGKLVFEAFGKWYVYRRVPFGFSFCSATLGTASRSLHEGVTSIVAIVAYYSATLMILHMSFLVTLGRYLLNCSCFGKYWDARWHTRRALWQKPLSGLVFPSQ